MLGVSQTQIVVVSPLQLLKRIITQVSSCNMRTLRTVFMACAEFVGSFSNDPSTDVRHAHVRMSFVNAITLGPITLIDCVCMHACSYALFSWAIAAVTAALW